MKKTMMILLIVVFMAHTAFAGGIWDMVKNVGLEKINSKGYEVEVEGTNIRAYVFNVQLMKSVCTNVWGERTQTLECKTYKEMGLTQDEIEKLNRK